ncbi:MAG: Mov34/MPN/PAD-1 family protein [Candidatus Diapherotrites archaeon]|uniref:Mov34/MPN/PAD-1 family protein n=1 Tax=Candidatus Iainarchaeum sp. TaxID=3101447 RepID=A0A938YU02_9ARCH|nr:Mov34/MPN/PAD-1 family protein [Candidatus Diapherotrites archaeon]
MVKVKRGTLKAILEAARNTYPREFIALLGSTKGRVLDEFIVLPSTFGESLSSIRADLLPYNAGSIGSVHSHPGPNARPSKADLAMFRAMGEIHLITAYPFSLESTRAYDAAGKELELEVVE